MVKAIYFIKRKPGMGLEDFRRYWLGEHARVVLEVSAVRKYVQSHTMDSGYAKREPIYDGIAELWYDSTDVMRRIVDTPQSRAAAADDEKFIDMSQFRFIITEERVQKENPIEPGMPKFIAFIKRKPGMAVEDFQSYWRNVHGPSASRIPGIRRYVQSHVRRSAYASGREPLYDGVAETWFEDYEAIRASSGTREYQDVRADERNFIAPGPLPFIVAQEHLIL